MKLYIYRFIQQLPENNKNEQIKEYSKYLEKEIEIGKKLGFDSDSYEINYLFNFFPKGIEIICDYDIIEIVYYNMKKNNKISGKALLPSPEFCFKLDLDKIAVKFFDFEFEIEDLEDIKLILSQILKIIQEKLKVAKLFIEPCLSQARIDLEAKQRESEKGKKKENLKIKEENKDNKYTLMEKIKIKNNINSLNTKTNTTDLTFTNNINEIKTMNKNNINIIGKKNYTYTTVNVNDNIIKNIEKKINSNKTNKNDNIKIGNDNKENRIKLEPKKIVIPLMKEDSEDEDKKTKSRKEEDNEVKNVLDDLDDEKSQITNKNDFFKDDNFGSKDMNISEDINEKKI